MHTYIHKYIKKNSILEFQKRHSQIQFLTLISNVFYKIVKSVLFLIIDKFEVCSPISILTLNLQNAFRFFRIYDVKFDGKAIQNFAVVAEINGHTIDFL